MSTLIEQITETENLHWAWKKTKNSFQVGDIWYDEIELSAFEANLYEELEKIKEEIKSGSYALNSIKPLPYPKGCDKETGNPRVRQTFEVSIRDQVTWIAVVNVIGSYLDYKMPWWSYGHRLYVPVWKNSQDKQWNIGWYRHSKGQLYRKWNQSWPLFRRNISLTAKIMCHNKTEANGEMELDEAEKSVYENNTSLPNNFKSKYLDKNYWNAKSANHLYWASIDFSKFYPKVKREVIVQNIFKYVKEADEEADFKTLINTLIDFRINHSEWGKELDEIDLGDPDNFQGLPTGLFVAGFLANVALLDVDMQISEDLENNRDIAHFRFVDDHVVLAYDFDKLKEWIEKYKKYLDKANTGAEFNFQKIEPKSLSNILDSEWLDGKNDEAKTKEQENAKKETKLDPAFPAPLMTQTLAKVSAISKCDFEFLSQNEEVQLISDLEHLLLTDFPDHELRKDTRVSFAVSILSRIIPNTKEDYTDIYECQKRIHQKIKDYQRKFEQKNKKSFITEKLHDLLFQESINIKEYFKQWEEKIAKESDKDEKKEIIKSIQQEKEKEIELRKESPQKVAQKNHVYKLLKKAISENPEKVRIWSRVIDYCRKISSCEIKEVYDKIKELSNQKTIHSLSVLFLRTLFLNVLANRIIQSVYSVINRHYLSQKEKSTIESFLKSIFSDSFLTELFEQENADTKLYYVKTYELYRFVLGSTIYILEEENFRYIPNRKIIEQHRLIDWNNNPREWINRTQSTDINAWLYWLLWQTHDKSSSMPLKFWRKLQPYINYEISTYKPLIQPFPSYEYLPKKEDDFLALTINSEFDEGWLFEVFKTGKDHISENIKTELAKKYPQLYNNIFTPVDNKINLWDFIQWQRKSLFKPMDNEIDSFNNYFDPRFSEWTALEFIRQILQKSRISGEDFFQDKTNIVKFHPANFLVQNAIIEKYPNIISWNSWRQTIKPVIENSELNFQISDERYTTKGLLELEQKVGEKAKVYALGIILLQLITHDTNFPWIWNSTDKSLIWENLLYKKIQNTPISSYTLFILQSCFSSKNRESFYSAKIFNAFAERYNNGYDDTSTDPPLISDTDTLERHTIKAQKIIERYQLSMENNNPRQLIPISLIQLSRENNPFENSK
jgi:hypothetical protein